MSLSIKLEPGMDGPPVWMVLCIPCLRAHATICFAVGPSFTLPSPTSPSNFTPASAKNLKSSSPHPRLDYGRPRQDFHATRTQRGEGTLRGDGHSLEPYDVLRAPGHVDFAGGDHLGPAAMQAAVNPPDLILSRRPITGNWMNVAIDQPRSKRSAVGINDVHRAFKVHRLFLADSCDATIYRNHRVRIEDRFLQIAAQQQPDISHDKPCSIACFRRFVMRHCGLLLIRLVCPVCRASFLYKLTDSGNEILENVLNSGRVDAAPSSLDTHVL